MKSKTSESLIRELLNGTGIEVNGKNPWDIQIHDPRFYDRVLREPHLTLGEGYMDGWWDCERIDELVNRLLLARLDQKVRGNWRVALFVLQSRLFNLQSRARAYEVGQRHYDLGNELYCAMLDRRLN